MRALRGVKEFRRPRGPGRRHRDIGRGARREPPFPLTGRRRRSSISGGGVRTRPLDARERPRQEEEDTWIVAIFSPRVCREGTRLHARSQRRPRESAVHRRIDRKKSRRQPRPRRDGTPDPSCLRASRRRPGPRRGEIRPCRQAARLCHRPRGVQHRRTGGARQVLRRRSSSVDRIGRAAPGRPRPARRGGARGRSRRLLSGKAAAREFQRGEPPGDFYQG